MDGLYLAAYRATRKAPIGFSHGTAASAFSAVRTSWPSDDADDPAFFSARHFNDSVTWGICRTNLRNATSPGDWVVFFAAAYAQNGDSCAYHCVAALQIESKISQADIFNLPYRSRFGSYFNLLMKPHGAGCEHWEPVLDKRFWHPDWLTRIAARRTFTRAAAVAEGHRPRGSLAVGGVFTPAESYVVFSQRNRIISAHPPCVATWTRGQISEVWQLDQRAQEIRSLTLDLQTRRRSLRVANQVAHPHIHTSLPTDETGWGKALAAAL